jgi:xylose dehydrogenase (NAD/NADP)
MYRHHPRTLKIQELVSSGAIGEICHINSAYTIQFGRPENYRWQPEAGGGSLWDIGCYPVSFTHLMMGTLPKEVYGVADQASSGVDSAFTGLLSYGSGATVRFFCSFKLPYSSRLEIQGSEGTIITESPFVPKRNQPIYLHQAGRTRKINTSMPRLLYQGEVEDLGQAVNTGASQRLPLSESREINQILSSLHVSALKGIPIKLQ